jgi:hypothetical protein
MWHLFAHNVLNSTSGKSKMKTNQDILMTIERMWSPKNSSNIVENYDTGQDNVSNTLHLVNSPNRCNLDFSVRKVS